ncbi:MAG: ATP-binding protein [Desulfobacterales bacterium]|jgi:PAS domain S-box-containing protein
MNQNELNEHLIESPIFTLALDRVSDSVMIISVDGTVRYVNAAFERATGYPRKNIVGQNIRVFKSQIHSPEFYRAMCNILQNGREWTGRCMNGNQNGRLVDEGVTISPIKDQSGDIQCYMVVKRDLTNEILLEKKLRQAQKMEAIGTLAGGIAHDFNNIVAAIMGYAHLANHGLPPESPSRIKLDKITMACERAKGLIQQILTFSRSKQHEKRPVKISQIINESIKLLRAFLPESIEIRQNISSKNGMALADPTQIHQVLMNLCTNAAHAMEGKNGVLEVCMETIQMDSEQVSYFPDLIPGNYVKLTVTDTGHGMDKRTIEQIFDPFFTTKSQDLGTGMGLAMVRGIVKGHRGSINVVSEPGKGSTFCIYLPTIADEAHEDLNYDSELSPNIDRFMAIEGD